MLHGSVNLVFVFVVGNSALVASTATVVVGNSCAMHLSTDFTLRMDLVLLKRWSSHKYPVSDQAANLR
jgi:hypothetical protein